MPKEETEKCTKDGLPESTHRFSGGVRQSICGNGHNWPTGSVIEAQRKAQAAKEHEATLSSLRNARTFEEYDAARRRLFGI